LTPFRKGTFVSTLRLTVSVYGSILGEIHCDATSWQPQGRTTHRGWPAGRPTSDAIPRVSGLEPGDSSEEAIGRLALRNTFRLTVVVVVGAVLLSLLFFVAFSGRLETTVSQAQTVQAASEDSPTPAGPLAPQDESASESPRGSLPSHGPVASFECMGYWCSVVQAFYAGPG
jgi:hypothetical protein